MPGPLTVPFSNEIPERPSAVDGVMELARRRGRTEAELPAYGFGRFDRPAAGLSGAITGMGCRRGPDHSAGGASTARAIA